MLLRVFFRPTLMEDSLIGFFFILPLSSIFFFPHPFASSSWFFQEVRINKVSFISVHNISTAKLQLCLFFSADTVCPVSRRGAPEKERGGAHGDPPRDWRHQQPHAGLPGSVLRRHRRDQVGSARADQRQGVRVEGGRQGRDHPRGRSRRSCAVLAWPCVWPTVTSNHTPMPPGIVHRRGSHAGHGVFLLPERSLGERPVTGSHRGHQQRHHPVRA